MKVLDHATVDGDHTASLGLRFVERRDHATRVIDVGVSGCPHLVADVDLARVDECLAVEAHVHALFAFGAESVEVLHVVEHTVEDDLVGFAGR